MIDPDASGRGLARLVASIPAANEPAVLRARIASYYDSYPAHDLTDRLALFAPTCRFEDPAGSVVATDRDSLRTFFTTGIPARWSVTFRLERTAVVGDEVLATSTLTLRAGERRPTLVTVNAHFVFDATGLISSVRTFFDEDAMTDGVI